jgi:GAF domain-containing protein
VTLATNGTFTTPHATDDLVRELDAIQYRDREGPCVDAVRQGSQINLALTPDGAAYPRFREAAVQRFITGVLSTPLRAGDETLGGLNCYSASSEGFPEADVEAVIQFTHHAAVLLANAATSARTTATNEQLLRALESRDLIGQAKGMLMERRGCTADEAFDELRRGSQRENRKLTALAEDAVARRRTTRP